jgi:hypothetical protein
MMHDDGKPGLCVPDKVGGQGDTNQLPNVYSKFNLVVPTVCIQNHTKKTTRVEFYDKKYVSDIPNGTVVCGVVTIHVQLLGVQNNCTHVVSVLFSPNDPHSFVMLCILTINIFLAITFIINLGKK